MTYMQNIEYMGLNGVFVEVCSQSIDSKCFISKMLKVKELLSQSIGRIQVYCQRTSRTRSTLCALVSVELITRAKSRSFQPYAADTWRYWGEEPSPQRSWYAAPTGSSVTNAKTTGPFCVGVLRLRDNFTS